MLCGPGAAELQLFLSRTGPNAGPSRYQDTRLQPQTRGDSCPPFPERRRAARTGRGLPRRRLRAGIRRAGVTAPSPRRPGPAPGSEAKTFENHPTAGSSPPPLSKAPGRPRADGAMRTAGRALLLLCLAAGAAGEAGWAAGTELGRGQEPGASSSSGASGGCPATGRSGKRDVAPQVPQVPPGARPPRVPGGDGDLQSQRAGPHQSRRGDSHSRPNAEAPLGSPTCVPHPRAGWHPTAPPPLCRAGTPPSATPRGHAPKTPLGMLRTGEPRATPLVQWEVEAEAQGGAGKEIHPHCPDGAEPGGRVTGRGLGAASARTHGRPLARLRGEIPVYPSSHRLGQAARRAPGPPRAPEPELC